MQTKVSQHYNQIVRIAGMARVMSRAAVIATILTWAPISTGVSHDNLVPARSSATPARVAQPAQGTSDAATQPMCADLGAVAPTREFELTAASALGVGCGVPGNLAAGRPASRPSAEQAAVAILLAWHVQARGMSQ